MTNLETNGKTVSVDVPAETPLLWTLRDELGLTGTKFGCGMALCGACRSLPSRGSGRRLSAGESRRHGAA
jgi:aerobic-type carbon monoxide dehydrogenase small subunit (CoxS/CutS family)